MMRSYQGIPAGTWRNDNVFTTSTRRRRPRVDVVKTLSLRHYCVMCPLESIFISWSLGHFDVIHADPLQKMCLLNNILKVLIWYRPGWLITGLYMRCTGNYDCWHAQTIPVFEGLLLTQKPFSPRSPNPIDLHRETKYCHRCELYASLGIRDVSAMCNISHVISPLRFFYICHLGCTALWPLQIVEKLYVFLLYISHIPQAWLEFSTFFNYTLEFLSLTNKGLPLTWW